MCFPDAGYSIAHPKNLEPVTLGQGVLEAHGDQEETKRAAISGDPLLVRGGRDSNPRYAFAYTHLAGEPNRPLWHLPKKGGGGGIRTPVPVRAIRFQVGAVCPLRHSSIGLSEGHPPQTLEKYSAIPISVKLARDLLPLTIVQMFYWFLNRISFSGILPSGPNAPHG